MGNLSASCIGYYTGDIVYDVKTFNSLTDSGFTLDLMLKSVKEPGIGSGVSTISGSHLVYKYEVDGKIYYRATEKGVHSKNIRSSIKSRMGIEYEVNYDPMNPSDSIIGKRVTPVNKAEKRAAVSLGTGIAGSILSFFAIPAFILGVISIVLGIKSLKEPVHNSRKILAICGMIFAVIGFGLGIVFGFFHVLYLFNIW